MSIAVCSVCTDLFPIVMGGVIIRNLSGAANPDVIEGVTIQTVQAGHYNITTDTFTDDGDFMTLTSSVPVFRGFCVFDLYDIDANGNPKAPRGIVLDTLILSFAHTTGLAPTETIQFYLVPEVRPELYTKTLRPFVRGENFGSAAPAFLTSFVYTSGGDLAYQGVTIGTRVNLRTIVEDPLWNGRICISWIQTTGSGPSAFGISNAANPLLLTFNTWSGHTGWIDAPNRRRTRAVHDYKMGYPALSDEFVPDGFLEGIMVHRDGWDPEDPDPVYIGSPLEGVVDDEIPNLE